jgi:hypothetical protein
MVAFPGMVKSTFLLSQFPRRVACSPMQDKAESGKMLDTTGLIP